MHLLEELSNTPGRSGYTQHPWLGDHRIHNAWLRFPVRPTVRWQTAAARTTLGELSEVRDIASQTLLLDEQTVVHHATTPRLGSYLQSRVIRKASRRWASAMPYSIEDAAAAPVKRRTKNEPRLAPSCHGDALLNISKPD